MESNNFTITVMSGAGDGKVFEMTKTPIILGRHPEDDVFLPSDRGVSRHHAQIPREDKSYYIEDVGMEGKGSTNGTYLRGKKVNNKTSISSGDSFLLGTVWLRLDNKDNILTNFSD